MMADSGSDDESDYWAASGFVRTPEEADASAVDPIVLIAELEALAAIVSSGADETGTGSCWDGKSAFYDALAANWAQSLTAETFSPADDLLWGNYGDAHDDTLLIAFGSMTKQYHTQVHSGEAVFEYVGACKRLGVAHCLFVKDQLQSWYLRAPGGFDALLELLKPQIARLAPRHVVTLGSSMGGYAAIRAAEALGADLALAFGPQVILDPLQREAIRLPSMEFDPELAALKRTGMWLKSLIEVVGAGAGATGSQTRIHVHTGSVSRGDVREAQLLRAAAPSRVDVWVHARCGHCVAEHLGRSALDGLLHEALAGQALAVLEEVGGDLSVVRTDSR
jgi:hypothetical protein